MNSRSSLKPRTLQRGQGLVEYALILVLVGIVVIGVLSVTGKSISGVFCTVVSHLGDVPDACVAEAPQAEPQDGDICISYTFEPHPWYYVWKYQGGTWSRIAEPGGVHPTCSFSEYPDNHSRDDQI